jgi:hypothetical protein
MLFPFSRNDYILIKLYLFWLEFFICYILPTIQSKIQWYINSHVSEPPAMIELFNLHVALDTRIKKGQYVKGV